MYRFDFLSNFFSGKSWIVCCFVFGLKVTPVIAQVTTIEGSLVDNESGTAVPYASIEIVGYSIGTSSNTDGTFTLKIPEHLAFKKISIKITCVGYENYTVENPLDKLVVRLNPSKILLKEVVISARNQTPEDIVKRAFESIRKNYNTKPFVYQTFYRHYCKDDNQYGRLIEAAVDIYKRKGYRVRQTNPGAKDEVKVMQLRRSFDNTKVTINHAPIALYTVMAADAVAFQARAKTGNPYGSLAMGYYEVSTLHKYTDLFEFELEGVTSYDDEEVYHISYRLKADTAKSIESANRISYSGNLYIDTSSLAFIRTESKRTTSFDTLISASNYKRNGNKYYLYHSLVDGKGINRSLGIQHDYHIELLTTNILTKNFLEFRGNEPGKETLFNVPYDSAFWDDYNVIKATPLEEKIVKDLEQQVSLEDQFKTYDGIERERFFSGKEDEERFNQFLRRNKGRVMYIAFWSSDCGACVRELDYSRKIVEKYKGRVAFLYVSLDRDNQVWRDMLKKHKLINPFINHYRIGDQSDAAKLFNINKLPRYVLVNKKGSFVNQDARQPTDPDLEQDIERLLTEKN